MASEVNLLQYGLFRPADIEFKVGVRTSESWDFVLVHCLTMSTNISNRVWTVVRWIKGRTSFQLCLFRSEVHYSVGNSHHFRYSVVTLCVGKWMSSLNNVCGSAADGRQAGRMRCAKLQARSFPTVRSVSSLAAVDRVNWFLVKHELSSVINFVPSLFTF
jgi:hypothetical protein